MAIRKYTGDNPEFEGTEAARMPVGTTAQRANAQVGDLRHNTDTGILEQYTADGWQGIASPPVVSSVSPDNVDESDDPQTLVITGSNFDSNASAVLLNSSSQTVSPTTSTRNSSSQITIVFSGGDTLTTDAGPYDIKVTNGNGLSGTLDDAVTLDNAPTWTTSAGNLGTVIEDEAASTITVAATDPEGGSVSYSVTSGALPTGLSLGSANGQITGTPNVNDTYSASGVTHNFDITADDGTGNTTPRSFNIIRKWRDGSTSSLAATSVADLQSIGVPEGLVYFTNSNNDTQQLYYDNADGGWLLVASNNASDSTIPSGTSRHNQAYYINRNGTSGHLGTASPNSDYLIGSWIDNYSFSRCRVYGFGYGSTNGSYTWSNRGNDVDVQWNVSSFSTITPRSSVSVGGASPTGLSASAAYFNVDSIRADYVAGGFNANANQTTIGGGGGTASNGDPSSGYHLGHGTNEGNHEGWYNSANTNNDSQGYTTWLR